MPATTESYLGYITIKLGIQQAVRQFLSFLLRQILHFLAPKTSQQPTTYTSSHIHSKGKSHNSKMQTQYNAGDTQSRILYKKLVQVDLYKKLDCVS